MKAWPRNIDFTVVRRHAGVLPRWVGTTWVIQAMAQSRLSSAKEQSNSGSQRRKLCTKRTCPAASVHAASERWLTVFRNVRMSRRTTPPAEHRLLVQPRSRAWGPPATSTANASSAKHTRVAVHCEEDGSGDARLLRNSGGPGNLGKVRPWRGDIQALRGCTARVRLNYRVQ